MVGLPQHQTFQVAGQRGPRAETRHEECGQLSGKLPLCLPRPLHLLYVSLAQALVGTTEPAWIPDYVL